jgi:hypothetical protein
VLTAALLVVEVDHESLELEVVQASALTDATAARPERTIVEVRIFLGE